MSTARTLINDALLWGGIIAPGETPDSGLSNMAFSALNSMIDSWIGEQLMDFCTAQYQGNLIAGTATYDIGPTSTTLITQRPLKIMDMFVRLNGVDFPCQELDYRSYDLISVKNVTITYPSYYYYNPTFPNGSLSFYPLPNTNIQIFIRYQNFLAQFDTLDTNNNYPPMYDLALKYNLASMLCKILGNPRQDIEVDAVRTKAVLQRNNIIPAILLPDGRAAGMRNGLYNIFSDSMY